MIAQTIGCHFHEVMELPADEVRGWLLFLQGEREAEREAVDKARRDAEIAKQLGEQMRQVRRFVQ